MTISVASVCVRGPTVSLIPSAVLTMMASGRRSIGHLLCVDIHESLELRTIAVLSVTHALSIADKLLEPSRFRVCCEPMEALDGLYVQDEGELCVRKDIGEYDKESICDNICMTQASLVQCGLSAITHSPPISVR